MRDNVKPKEKWEFDKEVAECFDDMLSRSIPEYDLMRELCFRVGDHYVQPDTYIVDVGCSNGIAMEPFVKKYSEDCKFLMMDVSEPMLDICREKYAMNGNVEVKSGSICEEIPKVPASLVTSVLTVQFTPIEYRQKIISDIYKRLVNGGAFVFVEKVLGNSYELDQMMVEEYYRMKSENQYTRNQIAEKRKSLEGVLVPITANWNEEMLTTAGFRHVDCFWRCLNFAAWVAVK